MKKKVTKYTLELIMSDLCDKDYYKELTESDDIHDAKLIKMETVTIDVEDYTENDWRTYEEIV